MFVATASKGSNHVRTIVSRLKQNRPDLVERMARGEFDSVQAAAREAG